MELGALKEAIADLDDDIMVCLRTQEYGVHHDWEIQVVTTLNPLSGEKDPSTYIYLEA